jgi:hypothetical protein
MLEIYRERDKDVIGRSKASCPADRKLWLNFMVYIEPIFFRMVRIPSKVTLP